MQILLSMVEQVAQIRNETVPDALQTMCTYLPEKYRVQCRSLVAVLSPLIVNEFLVHASPDTICYRLGICHVDQGKSMCHLLPLPPALNDVRTWNRETLYNSAVPIEYQVSFDYVFFFLKR